MPGRAARRGAGGRVEHRVALGRRERTKAANRAAILRAAREVFADLGYGAASVRDIVRRTDLATGTFYNYFPDKEAVFRALVDEIAVEARALRPRRAPGAPTARGSSSATAYRAYFEFLASGPQTVFELMRRNAGTIRTHVRRARVRRGVAELSEDLRRRRRGRADARALTPASWRRRWSARRSRSACG